MRRREPDLCAGDFGGGRKRRVLWQIVGDLKPGGFARDIEVAFGAYNRIIIETAQSDSQFRRTIRPVHDW